MICINCTFHYSVWSILLLFSYKFWNGWHQLIPWYNVWYNVYWSLSFLDVITVLQSLLLMSLHVVLPHLCIFRCTCSDCCSFWYHLRVGLSQVFECLLHQLWLPLVLVLFHSYRWLICQCFILLVPDFSWCQVALVLTSLLSHLWVSYHSVEWLSWYSSHFMMIMSIVDYTICTASSFALTCVHG
jgi:hypothetical protein